MFVEYLNILFVQKRAGSCMRYNTHVSKTLEQSRLTIVSKRPQNYHGLGAMSHLSLVAYWYIERSNEMT